MPGMKSGSEMYIKETEDKSKKDEFDLSALGAHRAYAGVFPFSMRYARTLNDIRVAARDTNDPLLLALLAVEAQKYEIKYGRITSATVAGVSILAIGISTGMVAIFAPSAVAVAAVLSIYCSPFFSIPSATLSITRAFGAIDVTQGVLNKLNVVLTDKGLSSEEAEEAISQIKSHLLGSTRYKFDKVWPDGSSWFQRKFSPKVKPLSPVDHFTPASIKKFAKRLASLQVKVPGFPTDELELQQELNTLVFARRRSLHSSTFQPTSIIELMQLYNGIHSELKKVIAWGDSILGGDTTKTHPLFSAPRAFKRLTNYFRRTFDLANEIPTKCLPLTSSLSKDPGTVPDPFSIDLDDVPNAIGELQKLVSSDLRDADSMQVRISDMYRGRKISEKSNKKHAPNLGMGIIYTQEPRPQLSASDLGISKDRGTRDFDNLLNVLNQSPSGSVGDVVPAEKGRGSRLSPRSVSGERINPDVVGVSPSGISAGNWRERELSARTSEGGRISPIRN